MASLIFKPTAATSMALAPAAPGEAAGTNQNESEGPDTSWVLGGYALVFVGAIAAWVLFEAIDPKYATPAAGFTAFAPLYVLAQAIERFMEPFTKYLGSTSDQSGAKKNQTEAKKDLANQIVGMMDGAPPAGAPAGTPAATPASAADKLAVVTRIRRNRTVIAWGIASAVAMVLCGIFGLQLLKTMGMDAHWGGLDVVITGLAVGSGTKPLHDLISNIQKAKDEKSNPPQAASP